MNSPSRFPQLTGAALLTLILAACGSGGSSSTPSTPSTPASQTITFTAPSTTVLVGGTATLSGTASSGLTVSYASTTPTVCTVSGSTATGVSIGSCSITASQSGNASYAAATPVTATFSIGGDAQTITFNAPTAPTVGNTATLAGTASSGLAVTFTSSTTSVCTVSGTTLTAVSAGTCTVIASQAGNSTYAAAASVSHTITIGAAAAVFSAGFPTSGSTTASGGGFGSYSGSGPTPDALAQAGAGLGANTTASLNNYYAYFQSTDFNTYLATSGNYAYLGVYVFAPGVAGPMSTTANTPGVTINGQSGMTFTFNNNPEWAAAPDSNVFIILTLGNLETGACNIQLETVMTPTGGATPTSYTIPFANFWVAQNCGNSALTQTSVAAALSGNPISKIDFQATGGGSAITDPLNHLVSGFNSSVVQTNPASGLYPSTISITGPITFQ